MSSVRAVEEVAHQQIAHDYKKKKEDISKYVRRYVLAPKRLVWLNKCLISLQLRYIPIAYKASEKLSQIYTRGVKILKLNSFEL